MLSPEGYYTGHYPTYVDETPADLQYLSKELKGKAEFEFEVSDAEIGTLTLKGEFPRLKPRHSRPDLTSEEIKKMKDLFRPWVEEFFDIQKRLKYFEDLIEVSGLLTAYADPFHSMDSKEFQVVNKIYFWLWHTDDVLELAIEENVPFSKIHHGTRQLLEIVKGNTPEYTEVEGCPGFLCLFNSLLNIYNNVDERCKELISGPFHFFLRRYFEAMRWYSVEHIEGNYSATTFKYWMSHLGFFDLAAWCVYLASDEKIPIQIFKSPSLRRMLDICNVTGKLSNDVLGLRKAFHTMERDNFIIFSVKQKGIPVQEAVDLSCQTIKEELTDLIMLRDAILYEFSYHPGLVKYVDCVECIIDGNTRIYGASQRHMAYGLIKLST